MCVKIFQWPKKSCSTVRNSQQLCVSQQQLCLSTSDRERAPGEEQRGEGHSFTWCRKSGNHWEKHVLFTQGASVCVSDLPEGEGQKCVPVQLLP